MVKPVYYFLNSTDDEKLALNGLLPPIELIKMKSICRMLSHYPSLADELPNRELVDKYSEYFISINKEHKDKIKQKATSDRKRYLRKKKQKPKKS